MKEIRVGWTLLSEEFHAAYGEPTRYRLEKDRSLEKSGFLSCPAVRSTVEDIYQIASPFTLHLRAVETHGTLRIVPVYPLTTLSEHLVKMLVSVEPRSAWRTPDRCILQVASPFVFFSDDDVTVEQFDSGLSDRSRMNWRLIPGKFNIYAWQRPVNWAVEWDMSLGDFEIRTGETQYCVRFASAEHTPSQSKIVLQEVPLSDVLKDRLRHSGGVSKMRRGTSALMKASAGERVAVKLVGEYPNE
jgi:hypothetical protein